MKRRIYLDNNSTTPIAPEVLEAMLPYYSEYYANPSSPHSWGRKTREAIEQARAEVAQLINAKPEEIIFTASGTEANNLAIRGVAHALIGKGNHLIISSIEHSSILNSLYLIEKWQMGTYTKLPVNHFGLVDPTQLESAITRQTILISIMHSNNEIGTIQPIKKLCDIAHKYGVYFHTDAVASAGKLPIDVKELGVDLMTISAHKLHGPKGVGALYVKEGTKIEGIILGGMQEKSLRGGTENLPGIVGFGKAAVLARRELEQDIPKKIETLRNFLELNIRMRIPEIRLNGHPTQRLCNTLNVSIAYVEGEALLMNLDLEGIAVSAGSACASGRSEPSHVLKAIGVEEKYINSPIRFSLDKNTTKEDIDYTIETLVKVVERLRTISPLWKKCKN
ncbi:MAG: cysteine desulfurase [candidate division WOR-3 bacterium]|nr:cysteine desulfurase [candidate division WOR-3 bacterium]